MKPVGPAMGQIGRVAVFAAMLLTYGCALEYRDSETGAVHLWGIGHIAMREVHPIEGKKAIVQSADTFGIATGVWNREPFITVGWERHQDVEILDANTAVRLEGPDSDMLKIKIGSNPPGLDEKREER